MPLKLPVLPKFALPKSLGQCADLIYVLKAERLAVQKLVDELQKRESEVKEHIINTLPASQASGIAGKLARVTIVPKEVPQAKDWPAIWKYIKSHDAFELVQRRLSDGAVQERWEHGVEIPGIERFNAKTLSINKV